ncbi:acetylglutamate kinase [Winogradskyella sp. A3E31]|uniref:acetylglutamate kinase n=1 Tax=Winogradskyella sp. A3E31 TaxID=3349637 RepID=UPI00398B2E1A
MKTLKIIKIGGNIIDDENAMNSFLKEFSKLEGPKLLVHGGGKLATRLANDMQVEVKMIDGRRITNAETLDIITMVYAGKINKSIIVQLQANDCNAVGFTGADGNTIVSVKRPSQPIDFGFVGDVKKVDTQVLETLIDVNVCPVFSAITHNGKGQLLNTNADTIASELAIAFSKVYKTELYYCFEKNGVLKDVSDNASVIKTIDSNSFKNLVDEGVISEGMLPKITNCISAVNKGVARVCIGSSNMLFQPNVSYTTIRK